MSIDREKLEKALQDTTSIKDSVNSVSKGSGIITVQLKSLIDAAGKILSGNFAYKNTSTNESSRPKGPKG